MKKILIYTVIYFAFISVIVFAKTAVVKGQGAVTYSGFVASGDKEKAYQKARVGAVERYFSNRGQTDYAAFDANRDRIIGNLDGFITATSVLNESDQAGLGEYSVTVVIEINETKLNALMRQYMALTKVAPG